MKRQWYYWHDLEVLGPFSDQQLTDLATAGGILRDDIVWREGVEGGVPAHKVQHLFAAALLPEATSAASESPLAPVATAAPEAKAAAETPAAETPASTWDRGRATSSGKSRATAGRGTTIVGQDGKNVKFRMKCLTCNHEDSSFKSMSIPRGTAKATFYCPKCRKRCSVEIHGHLG